MAITSCGIERTKSGIPAVWEEGGGWSNSGSATIICGPHGQKKKALTIRTRGDLACKKHALFAAHEGDLVIKASWWHGNVSIYISKITSFGEAEAFLEQVACYENGEWDHEPEPFVDEACKAAAAKCRDYHCRSMYWGIEPQRRY